MIAVDVNDVVEVYDAGLRVLNEGLGPDVAEALMSEAPGFSMWKFL